MPTQKSDEIKRLTTPLSFKNSKAYDSEGKLIGCCETLNDVRYIIEPKEGILSDDEILKYAPQSKTASKIRLNRNIGDLSDVFLIHETLPQILALFYTILLCIGVPVFYSGNQFVMLIIIILIIISLIYLYYISNSKNYRISTSDAEATTTDKKYDVKVINIDKSDDVNISDNINEDLSLSSLKHYQKEVNDLKILFEVKEEVVKDLIKKRFEPPQLTYDKFIAHVNSSNKLFYSQADAALNIINFVSEDTPRIREEIQNKINALKRIIELIDDLTNELIINMNNINETTEVESLLDDMENLIESVKKY